MFKFVSMQAMGRVRIAALMVGVLVAGALAITERAAAAGLAAVQYNYSVSFTAGQTSASKTVTPKTPAGKVFVIQNISIYRYPASTSTLQSFLGVGGGFIVLTDITGTGNLYPAATTTLTAYVAADTTAFVNLYRTGSPLSAETAYVTVTGYLTAN